MKKRTKAYIELSLGTGLAGSSIAAGKLMTESMPVFLSQTLSLIFALALLIPLLIRMEGHMPRIPKGDLLILVLQALLSMFLFRIFLLYGLKYTTAVESSIITGSTPAVTAVISFLFLKEKASWHKITGIACTVAGMLLINLIGHSSGAAAGSIIGNLFIFLAVLGEALLTILRKITSNKVSNLAAATYITLFAFLMFLPVSIIEALSFDFAGMSGSQWLYIIYYGIAVTAVAYILWFRGVSKVPASTAAVYTGFMPVTALFLSLMVLKEVLSFPQLAGAAAILFGIIFVSSERESCKA